MVHQLGKSIYTPDSTDFDEFSQISSDTMISPFQHPTLSETPFGREEEGFTRWQTQRGCLYRCSFCAFPNGYNSMYEMGLDRVRSDLELFVKRGVREVAVFDPIFSVHKDRAKAILTLIKDICPDIRFEIQTKLEHLDDELLNLIGGLNIVLECGIQTLDPVVQEQIKRRNNRDRIEEVLEKIKRYNISIEAHLIYGLPYQTYESLVKDYKFLRKYTKTILLFPLIRLKGTGLDVNLTDDMEMVFSPIFPKEVIQTRWMSRSQILQLKRDGLNLENTYS